VNAAAVPEQVERFRGLIAARLGLQFEDARMAWLAEVLGRRADASGLTMELYLVRLQAAAAPAELGALAHELTVGETYFFRNIEQFSALRERVVPERMRAGGARRCLRILSAGCASGEEPYSIAMTLRELVADASCELQIRAVDLNPTSLEKARRARYTTWSLRETPLAMQQRWFRPDGAGVVLHDTIRASVKFEARNLGEDDADLWQPGAYDVVFCRNVLMYFTPQGTQAVVARIARALAPGGVLFLGSAETLRGLSQDFHLQHTHGSFYYQRKEAVEPAPTAGRKGASDAAQPTLAAVVDDSGSWVEAIGRASNRVRALTDTPAPSGAPSALTARPWNLGPALELFQQERFAHALSLVHALPDDAADDPNVLLLHAVLLAHSGEFSTAEATCHRLLAIDELNAGAHYVLALCREGLDDRRGAADNDQFAVYLDPTFAMPRMHLGLLARRTGDREAMRRELGQAVTLLQREDASRLLLFGGGFRREALLALCRAELQRCGGPA
jgi:chemotaxis protein methyltransferase CheR